MTPISSLSRRALVAAAAYGALAPSAEARKRKRKPKPPPPPPLAFAAATVAGISSGPNANQFSYRLDATWFHPASGKSGTATNQTLILAAATAPDQVRAAVVARVRAVVAEALGIRGETVAEGRVQATVV